MVGISGDIPSKEADICLGNIIVNQPGKGHGRVVQDDFGKLILSKFEWIGFLNAPL
jgi:hypothetical protein